MGSQKTQHLCFIVQAQQPYKSSLAWCVLCKHENECCTYILSNITLCTVLGLDSSVLGVFWVSFTGVSYLVFCHENRNKMFWSKCKVLCLQLFWFICMSPMIESSRINLSQGIYWCFLVFIFLVVNVLKTAPCLIFSGIRDSSEMRVFFIWFCFFWTPYHLKLWSFFLYLYIFSLPKR